ncbi:hypothetical protein ACP275_10G169000 [Erythranthe tilingii]
MSVFSRMRRFATSAPDDITVRSFLCGFTEPCTLSQGKEQECSSIVRKNTDVISWSNLIMGYAQFGYGEEALSLIKTMKDHGIKPNQLTFVGVLTACSLVGLVEEGMELFESMEQENCVGPTREHFSCVVDLLARAGRMEGVEAFIGRMHGNLRA